jgi:hypothetical protein
MNMVFQIVAPPNHRFDSRKKQLESKLFEKVFISMLALLAQWYRGLLNDPLQFWGLPPET